MAVRSVVLVLAMLAFAMVSALPAHAAVPEAERVVHVELTGDASTHFVVDGRPYRGPIVVSLYDDGLALVEVATIDQYLEGIAEMPFSWPREALRAQAVASRTYLSRRLSSDRSGDAAEHGYDICATNRCQVYRGTDLVEGSSGDRWRRAVEDTASVVILSGERPIEAVFTSMVGSRSRANQDVWASDPVPYLQPVDSPEVGIAPYATWRVAVPPEQFVTILRVAGFTVGGGLHGLIVDDPPEGEGRTRITVVTDGGVDSVLAPELKGVLNRWGDRLYPGSLPAASEGGGRLPEPLPSYTYDISYVPTEYSRLDTLRPSDDRVSASEVVFTGEGWGHGVGMSQWGARIMAERGATYDEILGHYYGGLEPQVAERVVPDRVVVGLATGRRATDIGVDGTATARVNGTTVATLSEGTWTLFDVAGTIALIGEDAQMPASLAPEGLWPR